MKKLICVLLLLAMAISLSACASQEDKAIEAARAMMEDEDYLGAIQTLESIPSYQKISSCIQEAQHLQEESLRQERLSQAGFLFGSWKSIDSDSTLLFREDGTGHYRYSAEIDGHDFIFTVEDNSINLGWEQLSVTSLNGIVCLSAVNEGIRYVSEKDYAIAGPRAVEITIENWEEYFELRNIRNFGMDDFDEPVRVGFGYGIYLRDEYVEKLYGSSMELDVAFKMEFDDYNRQVEDPLDDNYVLGAKTYDRGRVTKTATVMDYRSFGNYQSIDAEYNSVAAIFCDSSSLISLKEYCSFENGTLLDVRGSIMLYP